MRGHRFETLAVSHIDIERLNPEVQLHVFHVTPVSRTLTGVIDITPAEARKLAMQLLDVAEGAEHGAHAMLAMRENKVPEEIVENVFGRIQQLRNITATTG